MMVEGLTVSPHLGDELVDPELGRRGVIATVLLYPSSEPGESRGQVKVKFDDGSTESYEFTDLSFSGGAWVAHGGPI